MTLAAVDVADASEGAADDDQKLFRLRFDPVKLFTRVIYELAK